MPKQTVLGSIYIYAILGILKHSEAHYAREINKHYTQR